MLGVRVANLKIATVKLFGSDDGIFFLLLAVEF